MTSLPQTSAVVPTQNPPNSIEILDMQRIDGRGAVKAVCRVRYGVFVFSGIKIIVPTLASRPFVGWPSHKVGDAWQPYISVLSPTLDDDIADAVLAEYRRGLR